MSHEAPWLRTTLISIQNLKLILRTQRLSSKANSLHLQYVNCRPHLYFFLQLSQADGAFYDTCEDTLLVFL